MFVDNCVQFIHAPSACFFTFSLYFSTSKYKKQQNPFCHFVDTDAKYTIKRNMKPFFTIYRHNTFLSMLLHKSYLTAKKKQKNFKILTGDEK